MVYDAPRKSIFPPGQHSNVAGGNLYSRTTLAGRGRRLSVPRACRRGRPGRYTPEVFFFFSRGGYHMLVIAPLTTTAPAAVRRGKPRTGLSSAARETCPNMARVRRESFASSGRNIEHGRKIADQNGYGDYYYYYAGRQNRHVYTVRNGREGRLSGERSRGERPRRDTGFH